ncbi:MAG: OsmC family peroxiredoxin [Chloroflexota bacterium]|nr:OsmC family peroxiredoxin [Chloroflexota bacterium]
MAAVREAQVTWTGALVDGNGTINEVTSSAVNGLPVTWASRTEGPEGKTSPEELVAAAHASCYAMAFSHMLNLGGTPPTKLEVSATVTFDRVDAGFKVVSSALKVSGQVAGIDAAKFVETAEAAKDGCPISQALKGNVELSVEATLE